MTVRIRESSRRPGWWRVLLGCVIAGHALLFAFTVLVGDRLSALSAGRVAIVLVALAAYTTAVAGLWWRRPTSAVVRWVALALVLLFAARLHIPPYILRQKLNQPENDATALVRHLRELSASQEQYRLSTGHYAASIDSLSSWITPIEDVQSVVRTNGDRGWSARSKRGVAECSIWVRDSTMRTNVHAPEGMPICVGQRGAGRHSVSIQWATAPAHELPGGIRRPLTGVWRQHRADERRTGIVPEQLSDSASSYRWTTRIGGELRASVAVAGSQLFVGAHGNGEFVSLSLDSGGVDWRIRVANWVHHEPVITDDLVIVTFGSNDYLGAVSTVAQAPGGIAAYDRRTGRERWHHYLNTSVMTSPVVGDSLVAVVTTGNQALAWQLTDGAERWRTPLPSHSWMGNPMVVGDRMIVGLEFTRLCILSLPTGALESCTKFAGKGWGAGHASVALADSLALIVYDEEITVAEAVRAKLWKFLVTRLLGIEGRAGQQYAVAIDLSSGRERWRVRLGGANGTPVQGHIAGTPVVVEGIAYIPSPLNGYITAVRTTDGRALWSTPVHAVRGSVLVTQGAVVSATTDAALVVLDAATGKQRCRQPLPAVSDRAGPTLAGRTALFALRNGLVLAQPIGDLLACRG